MIWKEERGERKTIGTRGLIPSGVWRKKKVVGVSEEAEKMKGREGSSG